MLNAEIFLQETAIGIKNISFSDKNLGFFIKKSC